MHRHALRHVIVCPVKIYQNHCRDTPTLVQTDVSQKTTTPNTHAQVIDLVFELAKIVVHGTVVGRVTRPVVPAGPVGAQVVVPEVGAEVPAVVGPGVVQPRPVVVPAVHLGVVRRAG